MPVHQPGTCVGARARRLRCLAVPATWTLVVLWVSAGQAIAEAFTFVEGSVGDYGKILHWEGAHVASGSGLNGSFDGTADASVEVTPFDEQVIHLHAFAQAVAPADADHEYGPPGVVATAQWSDVLTVRNPNVVPQPLIGNLYFYFIPKFRGVLSGQGARAELNLMVGSDVRVLAPTEEGPFGFNAGLKVAGNIFGLILGGEEVPPIDFEMTLTAQALAFPGEAAIADISHTVEFSRIYIGDADGNPLPFTPPIEFVGTSGTVYATAAIPEPSAAGLLACGAASLVLRRRRAASFPNVVAAG